MYAKPTIYYPLSVLMLAKADCLEEIAFNNGWLSANELQDIVQRFSENSYGEYLLLLLRDPE